MLVCSELLADNYVAKQCGWSKFVAFIFVILILSSCSVKDRFTFFPDREVLNIEIPPFAEEISIKTSDGETLQAYLFTHGKKDRRRPLIIYFHGNAGNLYYRFDNAIRLYQMDHDVLLISYRGYAKSTGTPSEQGIYTDGSAAVNFANEQLGYSDQEIVVFGRSLGSTVAVHISQQREFKKVILITPLTCGRDMAVAMGLGLLKFMAGNSYHSLEKINNLLSPLLIIHGDKDEVVPYYMGEALFQAYQGPKKMVTIPNARHNDLQEKDGDLYWNTIEKFLWQT